MRTALASLPYKTLQDVAPLSARPCPSLLPDMLHAETVKILVVDDRRQARHRVSRFVMKMGHTCVTARSGSEAIQAFMMEAPDLILMDVKMPEMDGYETAQRIRQQTGSHWTPILFLSASAEDDDQVKGLEVGGDDYLIKPVRYRMLKAKIWAMQRILDMQRTLHENAEQLALHRGADEGLPQPERQWRVHVELSATELKSLDVTPWLMWWVDNTQLEEQHRGQVFLILSELLNNALDHGLLGLDSRLKAESGGFERYIQMRTDRLAALSAGFIDIEMSPVWQAERELLRLGVRDSGLGFDHAAMLQAGLTDNIGFSGRGIGLVRDLCETLEYRGNGNEVVVLYPLN